MNHPHFSNSASAGIGLERPEYRRRFRGRLIVDSPTLNGDSIIGRMPDLPTLDQLCQMMRKQPDMSQQRIAEIRRKLSSGKYLTRKAAEETADRLIDND